MGSEKVEWYKTAKGKIYTRKYRKINASKHAEYKRQARKRHAEKYPDKIRCRRLVGAAVRNGFIQPPIDNLRNWHNHWEFHHPDYSRPYYGLWLTKKTHRLIDARKLECPAATDYLPQVERRLRTKWGLP
jgi:hypothetical protein